MIPVASLPDVVRTVRKRAAQGCPKAQRWLAQQGVAVMTARRVKRGGKDKAD